MEGIDPKHVELIGFALFVASELIGMSRLRSNSVLQLVLSLLMQAFPYRQAEREQGRFLFRGKDRH